MLLYCLGEWGGGGGLRDCSCTLPSELSTLAEWRTGRKSSPLSLFLRLQGGMTKNSASGLVQCKWGCSLLLQWVMFGLAQVMAVYIRWKESCFTIQYTYMYIQYIDDMVYFCTICIPTIYCTTLGAYICYIYMYKFFIRVRWKMFFAHIHIRTVSGMVLNFDSLSDVHCYLFSKTPRRLLLSKNVTFCENN